MHRDDVHIERAPSRCPFCRGPLDRPEELVACAGCGARHHDGCHREHGRCAACGATARLVFDPATAGTTPRAAPAWEPPPPRDVTRPIGVFMIVAASALTFAAMTAQLAGPRTGLFLGVLALAVVFGGTGVRCLRWRPPGAASAAPDPKKESS